MSSQLKSWISASRPKTLALAITGPLTAVAMALYSHVSFPLTEAFLCTLIAILLQVLSNFANDLGDYQKGTDQAANRQDRALTSGTIKESQMKLAVTTTAILSLGVGTLLLMLVNLSAHEKWTLFGIGFTAIIAAIAYTVGKKAYGYYGLGDVFVFIFFGVVSVLATNYILTREITFFDILSAVAVGCMSTLVLNINNMRDIEKDKVSNKRTIPVIIGFKNGRIYHICLAAIASLCWVILIFYFNIPFLGIPLFLMVLVLHLFLNLTQNQFEKYNEQLKFTSLLTLFFSIILFLSAVITPLIS